MVMPGRSYSSGSGYRYGFNEKENDGETGFQDYGFRIYNPLIARFISVDPLTTKYPWYTPYQFAGNKPIQFIDLDGLEEASPEQKNQPKGNWYRQQDGNNTTYRYAFDREKEARGVTSEGWWQIPEGSRSRSVKGENGTAIIDLHANGTFSYNTVRTAAGGHVRWNMALESGGRLNIEARDFMMDKGAGEGGSLVGAAEWLAGEKAASLALKGIGRVGERLFARKITNAAIETAPQSLGAGRTAVKEWLQNVGNLERGELIKNIEAVGFKKMSPSTSPVSVFERGSMRVRLDPPQPGTPFNHMHLEYGGNSYNIFLNPVNYRSPAAHIPIK